MSFFYAQAKFNIVIIRTRICQHSTHDTEAQKIVVCLLKLQLTLR